MKRHAMLIALDAAVPKWIERMKLKPWSYVQGRLFACAEIIARINESGIELEIPTPFAINVLAEGLACYAFLGGVTISKQWGEDFQKGHWEAVHPRFPTTAEEWGEAKEYAEDTQRAHGGDS